MSELITKQAVLNTLDNADKFLDEERTVEKYKELLTECIKVLPPAENKEDFISKRELYHKLGEAYSKGYLSWGANEIFKDIIGECHSVGNKGEWTEWKGRNGRYQGIPICSNCHTGFPIIAKDYKYCPECGADMRKAEKPETCKGCLEPCIMYEPDMRACKKKVTERGE